MVLVLTILVPHRINMFTTQMHHRVIDDFEFDLFGYKRGISFGVKHRRKIDPLAPGRAWLSSERGPEVPPRISGWDGGRFSPTPPFAGLLPDYLCDNCPWAFTPTLTQRARGKKNATGSSIRDLLSGGVEVGQRFSKK